MRTIQVNRFINQERNSFSAFPFLNLNLYSIPTPQKTSFPVCYSPFSSTGEGCNKLSLNITVSLLSMRDCEPLIPDTDGGEFIEERIPNVSINSILYLFFFSISLVCQSMKSNLFLSDSSISSGSCVLFLR